MGTPLKIAKSKRTHGPAGNIGYGGPAKGAAITLKPGVDGADQKGKTVRVRTNAERAREQNGDMSYSVEELRCIWRRRDERKAAGMTRAEMRERRTEALEDFFYDVAVEGAMPAPDQSVADAPEAKKAVTPETRLAAAQRLHAIYNGQPVARQINTTTDDIGNMTDDAIRDELAKLKGENRAARTVN